MNRRWFLITLAVVTGAFFSSWYFTAHEATRLSLFLADAFFFALSFLFLLRTRAAETTAGEVFRLVFGVPVFALAVVAASVLEQVPGPLEAGGSFALWFHLLRFIPDFALAWIMLAIYRLGEEEWPKRKLRTVIAVVLIVAATIGVTSTWFSTIIALFIAIWVIPTRWISSLRGRERWWLLVLILLTALVLPLFTRNGGAFSDFFRGGILHLPEPTAVGTDIPAGATLPGLLCKVISFFWILLLFRIIIALFRGRLGLKIPIWLKLLFTYLFSTIIPALLLLALFAVSVFIGVGTLRSRAVCDLVERDLGDLERELERGTWSSFTDGDSVLVGIYRRVEPSASQMEPENRPWFDPELTGANWSQLTNALTSKTNPDTLTETWELKEALLSPRDLPKVLPPFPGWSDSSRILSGLLPIGGRRSAITAAMNTGRTHEVIVAMRPLTPWVLNGYREKTDCEILIQPTLAVRIPREFRERFASQAKVPKGKVIAETPAGEVYSPLPAKKTSFSITSSNGKKVNILSPEFIQLDYVQTETDTTHRGFFSTPFYHGVCELKIRKQSSGDETWINGVIAVRSSLASVFSKLYSTEGMNRPIVIILVVISVLLFLVVFLSSVFGFGITRTITTAIARLRHGTDLLRQGDLDTRIELKNNDELGTLADSFNRMTDELKQMLVEVAEKERLEREVQIARQIQLNLLPASLPILDDYDLAARSDPALEVAGDYYDVFTLDDDRIAIALGDVSGKGVAAALLMSNLQASFQVLASEDIPIEEVADRLNRLILRNSTPEMFITCFLAVLNPETSELVFVNAGHDNPVLLRGEEIIELDTGGMMLGAFSDATYVSERIRLEAGDVLALYTDGLTEAMNEEEEEFGRERLIRSLLARRDQSAESIVTGVYEDIIRFAGETRSYSDDLTMLVLKAT